jgi:hypothetical protein
MIKRNSFSFKYVSVPTKETTVNIVEYSMMFRILKWIAKIDRKVVN